MPLSPSRISVLGLLLLLLLAAVATQSEDSSPFFDEDAQPSFEPVALNTNHLPATFDEAVQQKEQNQQTQEYAHPMPQTMSSWSSWLCTIFTNALGLLGFDRNPPMVAVRPAREPNVADKLAMTRSPMLHVATMAMPSSMTHAMTNSTRAPMTNSSDEPSLVWVKEENNAYMFEGTKTVYFGCLYARVFTGGTYCNSDAFDGTDPCPDTVKHCWYFENNQLVKCADEGGSCFFSDTKKLYFGDLNWSDQTNGCDCTDAVFGDPAYTDIKACFITQ